MKTLATLFAAGLLVGCAYPQSSIEQGAPTGHLRFVGPPGGVIRIDGADHGAIGDHPVVVDVAPGRHVVSEIIGGKTIDRDYEVGAGSTVEIGGEN